MMIGASRTRAQFAAGLLFSTLGAAATLGASPPAYAQNPGAAVTPDSVSLKDGSLLRGTITEIKEGSHVLLKLDGGQIARIRWDVVARVERAGALVPPGAPPPPPPSPALPGPAIAAQDMVLVHIDSPDPVRLESVLGKNNRFVCDSPCDVAVPLQGTYRISGGVRPSRQFNFNARPGDRVVLSVDPASKGGFAGGIVMVSLGSVSLLVGSLVYLVAAVVSDVSHGRDGSGGKTVGLVMLGVGVAGLAGGITLMVVNKSSDVDQSSAPGAAGASPAHARRFIDPSPFTDVAASSLPTPFIAPVTFRF